MAWFDPPLYKPGNRKCPKCGQPQGWGLFQSRLAQVCPRCQSALTLDFRRLAVLPILLIVFVIADIAVVLLVDSILSMVIGLLALLVASWFAPAWLASWKLKSAPELPQALSGPNKSEGVIRISRDEAYADSLRAYEVVLDGCVVGGIWQGQTVELDVPPGNHTLALKIDWGRSNIVRFDMGRRIINFKCGSSMRGRRVYLILLYMTLLFNRWIWLRQSP